jgi:hypothetical protein
MSKDKTIGLGLIGVVILAIGGIIGGAIIAKIDSKYESEAVHVWKDTAQVIHDQLEEMKVENDELRNELDRLKGEEAE